MLFFIENNYNVLIFMIKDNICHFVLNRKKYTFLRGNRKIVFWIISKIHNKCFSK